MVQVKDCHSIECPKVYNQNGYARCKVYPLSGQIFRIRQGHCPIIDKYFDVERQKAYEESKGLRKKVRIGQQKQRKR